ncbi:Low-density lipoprotein receptor- protein 2, partial [Cichlidogyrus casuarinus]
MYLLPKRSDQFKYQWIFNQTTVIAMNQKVLILNNVNTGDTGTYKCLTTKLDNSDSAEQSLYLYIREAEKQSKITVEEGTRVTIKCQPSISQLERGNKVFDYIWYGPESTEIISRSSTLELIGIRVNQEGKYTCVASYNDAESKYESSSSVDITVIPKSKLILPGLQANTKEVLETANAAQVCYFENDQTAQTDTYRWIYPDRSKVTEGNTLTLNRVLSADAGTYTCQGERRNGNQETAQLKLVVVREFLRPNYGISPKL